MEMQSQNMTPEQKELEAKQNLLLIHEENLAHRELELATIQTELIHFRNVYIQIAGERASKMDFVLAELSRLVNSLNDNPKSRALYEKAQLQAEQSAESVERVTPVPDGAKGFYPTENLKLLYRTSAKLFHPDLALEEADRLRREKLMTEVNEAYSRGNGLRLKQIIDSWEQSPEVIDGKDVGSELIRCIRKTVQVEERLRVLDVDLESLRNSYLYQLRQIVIKAHQKGRELLEEIADVYELKINQASKNIQSLIHYLQEQS